jgi:hypothetical protein
MKFKNVESKKTWAKDKQDQDDYGAAVFKYAEKWANLMEKEIVKGKHIKDIAKDADRQANEGIDITGFMYGCAVSLLSKHWEFGEELRKWHNLSIQIKDEGEKANKNGGVLNPALLTVIVKGE